MRRASLIALTLSSLLAAPVSARTVEDEQFWTSLIVGTNLMKGWSGQVQIQNRMTNHARNRAALLGRGMLTYAFAKGWTAAVSYAHTDMPLEPNARRGEDSLYQQVQYTIGQVGGGLMTTRLRLEQRWRDGREKTGWRARYELRWLKPLSKRPGRPSLLLWEEPVVELRDTDFGQTRGDMQYRTFAGLSIPLSKSMRVEPGYVNIIGHRQRRDDLFYHVAQVTLNVRL